MGGIPRSSASRVHRRVRFKMKPLSVITHRVLGHLSLTHKPKPPMQRSYNNNGHSPLILNLECLYVLWIRTNIIFFFLWSDALDALGLKRYCCRRMLLSHVDLIEKLLNYAPLEKWGCSCKDLHPWTDFNSIIVICEDLSNFYFYCYEDGIVCRCKMKTVSLHCYYLLTSWYWTWLEKRSFFISGAEFALWK